MPTLSERGLSAAEHHHQNINIAITLRISIQLIFVLPINILLLNTE